MSKICQNWEPLTNKKVQCHLCPKNCIIDEGNFGFCKVRQNIKGTLYLNVYGQCCGLSVDPIEKKPLYHFFPGSDILSFGTNGCNLDCQFCQNWTLSKSRPEDISLMDASAEMIVAQAKKHQCKSVAFTYNEPIIFNEFVQDVAAECFKENIKSVMVSAGYINPQAREALFANIDAANIDLKSFSDEFYQKYCFGKLQPVLDTLTFLKKETNVWLEVTTLLINGLNDSEKELDEMTKWIVSSLGDDVPLHFSAFHGSYKMKNHSSTSVENLHKAYSIAQRNGLKYVYLGNIRNVATATTYCYKCNHPLIKRSYFDTNEINFINKNQCPKCSAECAGIFE